jgi:hypothetical protein
MNERFRWSLGGTWVLAGSLCLAVPVFLPSFPNPPNIFYDPIGAATATMTVLSFPAGMLSIPFMFAAGKFFGIDASTIGGMYLNLQVLFALGLVQWFLVAPRILGRRAAASTEETGAEIPRSLPESRYPSDEDLTGGQTKTPVERLFDDDRG